ncbi:hypothetical protein SKAU_G00085040 [Synaphobranchus kaupii]|uniref:Uncharacterized protein n=1 Tax=Synaphobranchus kaupii TaxID=118154 RepID=A0A9Q1J5W5_SYNKA|nr:hypothetical protein SKAU_G00085040 [Synaphobranchus kaupii]
MQLNPTVFGAEPKEVGERVTFGRQRNGSFPCNAACGLAMDLIEIMRARLVVSSSGPALAGGTAETPAKLSRRARSHSDSPPLRGVSKVCLPDSKFTLAVRRILGGKTAGASGRRWSS